MTLQRPVHKVLTDLYNKPHLISSEAFGAVSSYLELRNSGLLARMESAPSAPDAPAQAGKIGIINIHGSLTNKPVIGACGEIAGANYANILTQQTELIKAGCKTIVLDIDSGGGEAFNCFATANAMRSQADANGVEMISYVQSHAASAAYALCVLSDEVVAHPQSQVGSIGVLVALMNDTKMLEKEGLSRTFVTRGANKIPFDAEGGFREEFLAELQEQVDDLYDQFCEHVSHYTGLSVEDVKSTEASMFSAKKALGMGMINSIMTNEAFAEYLLNR